MRVPKTPKGRLRSICRSRTKSTISEIVTLVLNNEHARYFIFMSNPMFFGYGNPGSSDPSEGDEQDKWALGGQGQFQEVIL